MMETIENDAEGKYQWIKNRKLNEKWKKMLLKLEEKA